MRRNVLFSLSAAFALTAVTVLQSTAYSEEAGCIAKTTMFEVIEGIPKKFPMGEKDNVYIIDTKGKGALTATIEELTISFFDSRYNDPKKWGTVSNKLIGHGIEGDMEKIGCVHAGINNYDTGKVDMTEAGVKEAQQLFKQYVDTTLTLLKN